MSGNFCWVRGQFSKLDHYRVVIPIDIQENRTVASFMTFEGHEGEDDYGVWIEVPRGGKVEVRDR
jgi:hypothetical protein